MKTLRRIAITSALLLSASLALAEDIDFMNLPDYPPGWPLHECVNLLPTPENVVMGIPDVLWEGAKEITPAEVPAAPTVVMGEFPPSKSTLTLGGCYDTRVKTIQIVPQSQGLDPVRRSVLLMHEYTHALLDAQGIPAIDHHCEMAKRQWVFRALAFLFKHGYDNLITPWHYQMERYGEMAMCGVFVRQS